MSNLEFDPHEYTGTLDKREDHAPGDVAEESAGHWVLNANLGLGFSVVLTVASFWAAGAHWIWGPAVPMALIVLAIAQMGVHLVYFLHITTGPDNTNNVLALAYGVLVVFLILAGSVWIMAHLADNMMPMDKLMDMAR
ncbi:cytochrome o ubiquinol oxidase operon protein cyoD [Rhodoblastus acidophilus]|uniref:cytochrome o ubiquinol oxidase subunit IV n=1 Tax=Rhodoblastus acidophilus TaxID=1074 RepID=UPI0022255EC6|nr:cytochrome o ubiquinol oxidase subunit IV [Rhodoblastus acidophilus]MCW2283911.1 cytochrome o ubiquinol oxidase operon protein cyoD [Rhodoblastus acidophilus]MCW2332607.1 cytochrome o ubiquinol oxidase operon protein cyoD [Rhodoblastus acidophilus]